MTEAEAQSAEGEVAGTPYHVTWIKGAMFCVTMPIRVMPYVRMTQRGKWAAPRAIEYLAHQKAIRDRVILIMTEHEIPPFERKDKLRVHFKITRTAERGDFDNFIKAVADALQNAVYPNDSQIRSGTIDIKEGPKPNLFAWVERIDTSSN